MSEINISEMIHRPSDEEIMSFLGELGLNASEWEDKKDTDETIDGN